MDTPINEPGPLYLAPAAGDGVLPPVVPDSVPVLTTLPGSAPLSLILGGFLALLLSAWAGIVPFIGPEFRLLTRWDGLVDLESRPWARRGRARRGRPARLSRHRRDSAPSDRHARCSSARRRRVLDLLVRGLVRVGPGGLARARRKLLPCRVAVLTLDYWMDLRSGQVFCSPLSVHSRWACWTGVTPRTRKTSCLPCRSACMGPRCRPGLQR